MIKIYNRFNGDLIKEFDLKTFREADLSKALLVIYGFKWQVL